MEQTHIPILKVFDELRFNLGKRTLIEFIKGNPNATIDRNNLDELNSYGCLYSLTENEIESIIDQLIKQKFLEIEIINGKFKVLTRTNQGKKEIYEKKFKYNEKTKINLNEIFKIETKITKKDEKIFETFDFFLNKYNTFQKKAIISSSENILTIAGAGSGKTTVLTKRIEFLTKFLGVSQKEILAITFTKKSKEEMIKRLNENNINNINVETFNSFCEKILKKNEHKIYKKNVKVLNYSQKIKLVKNGLKIMGTSLDLIGDDYFNKRQQKEKSKDELFFIFVNDVFSIIDFYKNLNIDLKKFYEYETNFTKKRIAKIIYNLCLFVKNKLVEEGLRDFSDQILDTLNFFKKNPNEILKFKHLLIDEFQDVNHIQFELIKILNAQNLFAVGDPRQAIYGWRGSDIKYILNFNKEFKDVEIINLKNNYRSNQKIVELINLAIKPLGLIDLEAAKINNKNEENDNNLQKIFLINHSNEIIEKQFILESIKNSKNKRDEIFVLARTNKVLNNFANFFNENRIKFSIKSEEEFTKTQPKEDEIVLATIHSIKGMEAEEIYLIGANSLSFPNRVVDNFIFSLIKEDFDYDKEAEELRLFYVALSRAKDKLIISFTGNPTKYISDEMKIKLKYKSKNKSLFDFTKNQKSKNLDSSNSDILKNMIKDWRNQKSQNTSLPLYMILSNKSIEEICKYRPQSKAEMFNINGLGEMKIAKYGDELLKIING